MKTKKWFIENIGNKVFRDNNKCSCATCKDVLENGMIIIDKSHAEYLYLVQHDYASEGIFLNYRKLKEN